MLRKCQLAVVIAAESGSDKDAIMEMSWVAERQGM